jgi:hypothetical protein
LSDWANLTSLATCQGWVTKGGPVYMPVFFQGIFVCSQNGYHSYFSAKLRQLFDLKEYDFDLYDRLSMRKKKKPKLARF